MRGYPYDLVDNEVRANNHGDVGKARLFFSFFLKGGKGNWRTSEGVIYGGSIELSN